MNSDHVVAGGSVTAVHSSLSILLHHFFSLDIEIAQAISVLGLSIMAGLGALVQWLYARIPTSVESLKV